VAEEHGRPARGGDAFDPSADPNAPGAPRILGTLPPQPSGPLVAGGQAAPLTTGPLGEDDDGPTDPGAPLDLTRHYPRGPARAALPSAPPAQPGPQTSQYELRPGNAAPPPGPAVASIAPATPTTPREEYDLALAALRSGQYEAAEIGFRAFLQKHPKDRLVADATYNLGESYFRRARTRDAAEQYLKVSTDYEKSSRAPLALIKLGISLEKLGSREQACTAYGEVGRRYPNASASIRANAEREMKRAQC
jgi:tol-pal system protein YbgF